MLGKHLFNLTRILLRDQINQNTMKSLILQSKRSKWKFTPFDTFKKFKFKSGKEWKKQDLNQVYSQMEKGVKGMENEMAKLVNEPSTSRFIQRPWMKLKRLLMPIRFKLIRGRSGARKMKLQLDMSEFKPEEIRVTIKNRIVSIHAKKTESDGNMKSLQEFRREFTLPEGITDENVSYTIDNEGMLEIEAALPRVERY